MWPFSLFTEVEEPEIEEIAVPVTAPVKGESPDLAEYQEWQKLATSAGINAAPYHELTHFLREEGISIYSGASVFSYLSALAIRDGAKWWLWPLRDRDGHDNQNLWAYTGTHGWKYCEDKRVEAKHGYRDVVPTPVLITVNRILDHFGDRARFYVAVTPDEDPFLAVSIDHCTLVFVERWDEPSFRRE